MNTVQLMQCSWTWLHWYLDLNWGLATHWLCCPGFVFPLWTLVVENIENRCEREEGCGGSGCSEAVMWDLAKKGGEITCWGWHEKRNGRMWQGPDCKKKKKASKHLSECSCFTGEEETYWLEKTGKGDSWVEIISIIMIIVGANPSPPSCTSAWCCYSSHFID